MAQLALSAVLAAGLAVGAGCGSDDSNGGGGSSAKPKTTKKKPASKPKKVDVASIESSLKSSLSGGCSSGVTPGASSGPKVSNVDCPANASTEPGSTFACAATGEVSGDVAVTMKDGGAYSYKGELQGDGVTQEVSGTSTPG